MGTYKPPKEVNERELYIEATLDVASLLASCIEHRKDDQYVAMTLGVHGVMCLAYAEKQLALMQESSRTKRSTDGFLAHLLEGLSIEIQKLGGPKYRFQVIREDA